MADLANLRISVDSREVKTAISDLTALGRASGDAEGSLKKLGAASAILGTALAAGFIMAAKNAIAFEKSIAEISTLVDTAVVSVDELSAAVRNQSKAFGGDTQTQARALYQIISAGASDAATANNILTTANKLAAGGVTDVLTAADGLTSVLNAYGSQVAGATAVSDAMFVAMKGGKTTIAELSSNLGAVAPLAAQMGISFDELTASTAALTKGGVSTSVAMTGLRAILATIAKPSKEATDLAAQLGIEFNSAGLKAKGLSGFMEELKAKTGGSSDAMATLFGGVEALVPALALSGKAGQDLVLIMEQMAVKAGATDEAADKMSKTFAFQFGKALANVNDIILSFGLVIQATLLPALTFFNNNLEQIQQALKAVAFALAGATAAFIGLKVAMGVQALVLFIGQVYALVAGLGLAGTASVAATFAMNGFKVALASTGIGIVIVAIGALAGAMYSLATAQATATEKTNSLISSLKVMAQTRSAGFAQARTTLEIEARLLDRDIGRLKEKQKLVQGGANEASFFTREIRKKQERLDAIRIGTAEADAALKTANAMAAIPAPAAAAAVGIAKTGKAAKEAIDPLEKYRDALAGMVEEGQKIGMTPEAIKAFEVEKLALEAAAAGRKKYNKASQEGAGNNIANDIRQQGMLNALNQQAADIRQEVSEKLKDYAKSIVEANKAHSDTMTTLRGEATLLGLVGVEREKAALLLEKEAYELKYGATAWEEYHKARTSNIDAKSVIDKDIEALQTLTNNLETAAGMIGGKTGRSIQGILKTEITMKDGETKKISEAIASTFPQLGTALSAVLAGAQIGQSVDGLFKSVGIKSSKAGAQIGGAIGMAAFGPVGAIAGSILGGVIGGMLKKTKTASATISQIAGQGMQTALTGNSAALKDVANTMATGLLKGLGSMAEQLGGTLGGNVKVSLGMRNKDFVVDPTGGGRTKGAGVKNFGTDEAAAVAYVTQLAIQQGIVTGISAGAQTLIRAGNDLNEQVQKALKFDQVFKDLVNESDPLRASLDELSIEMEKLKVIFAEAGASAADYAKLEELYAIKQAKAIFEANRPRRELEIQLMEAQGRSVEALAASRQLELEAMDASLRSLQSMIYAEQDLSAARAAEQSAISDLRAAVDMLNSNVAEAEANLAEALRAQRERQMESYRAQIADLDVIIAKRQEAQDALRRAYDAEIARIDDEISKRNSNIKSLEDAYSSQASIMQGTIDQFRDFASSLRDFAASIIPMNGTGPQSLEGLRRRFADVTKAALGGDKTAMGEVVGVGGQLRESIMANASDRTSMLRQLYALQAQTNTVVSGAEDQATIAERQLAEAKLQSDHLVGIENKAIAQLEAQKSATTALVGQFIQLTETNLSLDEAIRQLQTAEQAAVSAEQQKAYFQGQIDALTALDASVMSVEQAQRELDEAKAERDAVLAEINERGFAELIRVTQQTGAEMARIAMSAISSAQASAAQAQAAIAATTAAAAVTPPVVPVVPTTPPVGPTLPDLTNVIPFPAQPIMDGGFGSIFGNFDGLSLPQNFNGGGGREFGLDNNVQLFANGGFHSGGLRIVGENGPEIEATGPSRIYNSNQLGNMLNHGATADEVKALRDEMKVAMYQIAKNTGKSYDIINRWNGDGLPPERNVG